MPFCRSALAAAKTPTQRLVDAAEGQIGVTVLYDPSYAVLSYPGGDVPPDRGVCTDVVIRAYRRGLGLDLQRLVHEDMLAHFSAYPGAWGLSRPDANIDHRRVPNLQTFFARHGARRNVPDDLSGFQPGELVTMMLPGNLPHIGIISDTLSQNSNRRMVVHNIGGGAARDDLLGQYRITGRYLYFPHSGMRRA